MGLAAKGNLAVHLEPCEDNSLVQLLRLLREAIDELHWKHDAVALALGVVKADGTPDSAYFSKMLAGTKPFNLQHLVHLPDDIEARFAKKYTETFGIITVEPVGPEEARRMLAIGLFSHLASSPRTTRMAKAHIGGSAR